VLKAVRGINPLSQTLVSSTVSTFGVAQAQRIPLGLLPGQINVSATIHNFPAIALLKQSDCTGPNSSFSRSNYTEDVDEDGNWLVTEVTVNKTNCPMAGRQCNWGSRSILSQTDCES